MAGRPELVRTFVELSDTLADDFDISEFLHLLARRFVDLLDVDASGVMLGDHRGELQLIATSTERPELVDLIEHQRDEGPCLDAYRKGEAFSSADLRYAEISWPRFARAATRLSFAAVHAFPMQLRAETIGTTCLLRRRVGALSRGDLEIARALGDIATIAILQHRGRSQREVLASQLQTALNSRVIIEQAKGVLAERRQLFMDEAFNEMRGFARSHNRRLTDVAYAVVRNEPEVGPLTRPPSAPGH
jgi:GAF domain-containing protein